MKIGCLIEKASDWKYKEVKVFNSYTKLMKYMREKYDQWVVEFLGSDERFDSMYIKEIKEVAGECDLYIRLIIYDDWIE